MRTSCENHCRIYMYTARLQSSHTFDINVASSAFEASTTRRCDRRTDRCDRSPLTSRLSGFNPLALVLALTVAYLAAFLQLGFTDPGTITRGTDKYISGVPQDRICARRISASTSFTNFIRFVPRGMSSGPLQ